MLTKLLLLCGGPSDERNISLNSARSVYDHLEDDFEFDIVFIDKNLDKFLIDGKFLYSNTTTDFDFKLRSEGIFLDENNFLEKIQESDIVLPIMHGAFAEDGKIQKILEMQNANFIGSGSKTCENIYNKENADDFLRENGYFTVPKLFLDLNKGFDTKSVEDFFSQNHLKECIIKPVEGGSSFGIYHAKSFEESLDIINIMRRYGKIVLEQRCIGQEFTVMVLQNKGNPVALIPTEIEIKDDNNKIFDTRRKYLSTNETHYHCPPRFSKEKIDAIRRNAENLFRISGAKDFLRIDGWVLENGDMYFSDFNPISGMEQNSFIFQQGAKIGMNHREVLNYIVDSCAYRNNLKLSRKNRIKNKNLKKVNVIFGGITSERQVSLLSGSNVWLKMSKSKDLNVEPFLLFKNENNSDFQVAHLPYVMVLNHTVEEILYQCQNDNSDFDDYKNEIRNNLGLSYISFSRPEYFDIMEFLQKCKSENAYLFIALHGGFGENGEFQKILEKMDIKFNGSGEKTSNLCMNKFKTNEFIDSLNVEGIEKSNHELIQAEELLKADASELWEELRSKLGQKIIVKPNCDGSSSGIVVMDNENDLKNYVDLLLKRSDYIPKNVFKSQDSVVNMGKNVREFLFESFIETDPISIENGTIDWLKKTGWIELTVGVLENHGIYHSLNPSITVAQNMTVLSVEEKFQGGTGVNITPPPESMINKQFLKKIKDNLEFISEKIGIKDYCRIDIFANTISEKIKIIEFNTLPALTPSTVIFQQSAKEDPSMSPLDLILNISKLRD